MTDRLFPITPPPEGDPRFTVGLAVDVADVLHQHGYPLIASGADMVELQQAMFRFLYGAAGRAE
ncbi:hypothetical protein AB0451_03570 [Streptomyces sp. NPDC052000]|uniref:hypothetical protein n=1 Tax=Streptomyces sp. NPDC052000 TaxID=3155676 RepID=UPI00344C955F